MLEHGLTTPALPARTVVVGAGTGGGAGHRIARHAAHGLVVLTHVGATGCENLGHGAGAHTVQVAQHVVRQGVDGDG